MILKPIQSSAILIKRIVTNSLVLVLLAPVSQVSAEELGRLFTTPKERALLEKLRSPKPEKPKKKYAPITIVDHKNYQPPKPKFIQEPSKQNLKPIEAITRVEKVVEPEYVIIETPDIPNITVNGFVKRSGGRSTAWVNGMNTNDGYFEPQHIKVNPHRVGRDHIHVEVDDINIGDVSMKVGQTLDPKEAKITDTYQMIGKSNAQ